MIRKVFSILIVIGIWWIAALFIDRSVILPLPTDVFYKMFKLTTSSNFYISVVSTLLRVTLSLLLSMIIGVTLGIVVGLYKNIEEYISPIMTLLQSIPQISFILILFAWFKSTTALLIIVLLILLPVFYNNSVNGIHNIDRDLKDVITLYHHPLPYTLRKVYIPLIKGYILSAIDTCVPLSFKTGVMAEIFVQTRQGIGSALFYARVQIDMVSIFAWTLWMAVIVTLLLKSFTYIRKKFDK